MHSNAFNLTRVQSFEMFLYLAWKRAFHQQPLDLESPQALNQEMYGHLQIPCMIQARFFARRVFNLVIICATVCRYWTSLIYGIFPHGRVPEWKTQGRGKLSVAAWPVSRRLSSLLRTSRNGSTLDHSRRGGRGGQG